MDEITRKYLEILFRRAEPALEKKLREHGVTSPSQLPEHVARDVFREVVIGTAAALNPDASIEAIDHGLRAMAHPAFSPAFNRLIAQNATSDDAFAPAQGIDAAIVLAGFGLAVAPLDKKQLQILDQPSNNIDTVLQQFSQYKTAFVGYSSADSPFYIVITDCVRTLLSRYQTHPKLAGVKTLIERSGDFRPQATTKSFQHGIALFAREPGDRIATSALLDRSPTSGSIMLYAGWREGDAVIGASNNIYLPVPLQFLRGALRDPQMAMWIWRPVGARTLLH